MNRSALPGAALLCLALLIPNAIAGSADDSSIFPDGTILPPALSLPAPLSFPESDVPSNLSSVVVPLGSAPRRTFSRAITVTRAATSNTATSSAAREVASRRSRALMTLTVRSTGYNSLRAQTDNTPHVTATGARTRFGIVALSRDLLRAIPYGSRVLIRDLGTWSGGRGAGRYDTMLRDTVFVVEDTMHPRKSGTVDVWFPARRQAIQWGVRRIQITVIQRGR